MADAYARLTDVADLPYDDQAEQDTYREVQGLIDDARAATQSFRGSLGLTGASATAALEWLAEYERDLQAQADALAVMVTRHNLARAAMVKAAEAHRGLRAELVTPFESRLLRLEGPFVVAGREISPTQYIADLRASREAERNTKAAEILDAMNKAVKEQSSRIREPLPQEDDSSGGSGSGGSGSGGSGSGGSGSSGSGSTGSGTSGHHGDPYAGISLPAVPVTTTQPSPGSGSDDPGSPPITYPVVSYPDGPVTGTYPPPSVAEPDDPRWDENYHPGTQAGVGLGTVGIVGGVLGLGGVLGARALGSGLTGSSLAFQTAAGAGNAAALGSYPGGAGSYGGVGGSGLGTGGLGSAGAGSGGAGAGLAGRAPAGGLLSQNPAGRSGAGGRGAGAQGATGAGAGKDRKDKRRHRLVGYRVDRVEDDEAGPLGDAASAAAGNSEGLIPLPDADSGDRW